MDWQGTETLASKRNVRIKSVLHFCTVVICLVIFDFLYSLDEAFITAFTIHKNTSKAWQKTPRLGHILLQIPIEIQLIVHTEM